MKIPFLDLRSQYLSIKNEIDDAITQTIDNCAFIGGKNVQQFEQDFSAYTHSQNCISVGNGTDALEIAIEALELPKNSEIIVPANSFIASSEAITKNGHKPVFCDVNQQSYTIDPHDLVKRITPKTTAIIVVHLYGMTADMQAIIHIAQQHNLKIIEDNAQAHGATYEGKQVGQFGELACYSFYPGKNLGCYGDGGAITTNNAILAKKCKMIANHGRVDKYLHEFEGRNSRLDGIQAAILSVKLKYLKQWTEVRQRIAQQYQQQLFELDQAQLITLPKPLENTTSVWHLFVIQTQKRDELIKHLNACDIQTGIHYPIALPKLPAYAYLGQQNETGYAWQVCEQLLSIPIGEHLTAKQVDFVCKKIKAFF